MANPQLEKTLHYFPISSRPFEFNTGLRTLRNEPSQAKERIFQIDEQWPHYRDEKLAARKEEINKYVCTANLSSAAESRATVYLINQFSKEHPALFKLDHNGQQVSLHCQLSGETLIFDQQLQLIEALNSAVIPKYKNALDALCCQIQEDVSITEIKNGHDTLNYLHLCLPNYWAAEDKIGMCFSGAHKFVPAMNKISAQAPNLVNTLMRKGPFERFTWGLTTDDRLNHHPRPPTNQDQATWYGRIFDSEKSNFYLRIERQVTVGLPDVNAFIFTIRTYHRNTQSLTNKERESLIFSLNTMPTEVLEYKGLINHRDQIISRLRLLNCHS